MTNHPITASKPQRLERLELTLEADSVDDMVSLLDHLAFQYSAGQMNDGVSGGVNSSAMWKRTVNEGQTPEQYQADLKNYVDRLKAERTADREAQ